MIKVSCIIIVKTLFIPSSFNEIMCRSFKLWKLCSDISFEWNMSQWAVNHLLERSKSSDVPVRPGCVSAAVFSRKRDLWDLSSCNMESVKCV